MSGARSAALTALRELRRGAFSSEALELAVRREGLARRDAALCERIVRAAVQNLAYLDYVISLWCRTPVKKLEPLVLDILRLSASQLIYLDRVPASAAVSEGVKLCRESGCSRAEGLVNAVLRRIAENRGSIPEPPGSGGAEYLSVKYSHPLWLTEAFIERRGYEGAEALLAADNAEPPLTIQVNTLRTSADALECALRSEGISVRPGLCRDSFDLEGAGAVKELPGFDEGLFFVQDAAAHLAVESAGIEPGMSVLDACSAPGGKSFTAAMLLRGEGEILACDLKEKRLRRVAEGAERLGIGNISCRAMDARTPGAELHGRFDVVIADAPCSGLGVIRRKPEIRFKRPDELEQLPEIQLGILRGLADCVKPGGTLLYSTCTLLERENELVSGAFLAEREDFERVGERTLWPDTDRTDGFYICRMKRSI